MYFDVDYYLRVLRHVWSLRDWPGRSRTLARLLLVVPPLTLFNALCFLLDYVLFPSLWRQRVERPVFIVGHARSGTTLMHRLMSADGDRFSYFLYWETLFPSLLQKKCIRMLGWIDEHWLGSVVKKRLQVWDDKTFGPYRHMHNMSLWIAEEDQFSMKAAFVTQQWSLDIPMMDIIDIFHVDQMSDTKRRRWTRHYRELIKRQLLLNGGDKTHLSKNPVMSGWVKALIEEFPDARIVVMMRDPADCIPSVLKLVELTWKGKGWTREQYARSLHMLKEVSYESFTNPAEQLAARPDTPAYVADYRALTANPRETVREAYTALGLEYSEEYDSYLQAQGEREKKHNSKFEYSLGEYDLPRSEIENRLADFYQRYNWPREADLGQDVEEQG